MKILLSTLLLWVSLSHAQQSVTVLKLNVPCASEVTVTELLNKHGETPMLRMTSSRDELSLQAIMFVNPTTHTYTILEQVADNMYCVTGAGEHVTPYNK